MSLEFTLYKSLISIESQGLPIGLSSSGKKFEDYMVRQLYTQLLHLQVGYRIFPPRYTLRNPTFSGVCHQFDLVVAKQDELVTVECKFREYTHIDELFATQGKIIDYCQRPKGIFLTTALHVNDEMYYYAMAQKIKLICPSLPTVEYMLHHVKDGTSLADRLEKLSDRIDNGIEPHNVLIEWKNDYQRFLTDGYH